MLTDTTLRLTTDARVPLVERELPFVLDRPIALVLGPDETLNTSVESFAREASTAPLSTGSAWTRSLSIPFEWQDAVIRAAITLKLCQYEGTGAIVAALTTSIPEGRRIADETGTTATAGCATPRSWFGRSTSSAPPRAWRSSSATSTPSPRASARCSRSTASTSRAALDEVRGDEPPGIPIHGPGAQRQPGVATETARCLRQRRHGLHAPCSSTSASPPPVTAPPSSSSNAPARLAYRLYDQPDAGLWEFRGRQGVHTYSSVMCWVAADRLARIAVPDWVARAAAVWRGRADEMRERILQRGLRPRRRTPSWRRGVAPVSTRPRWCLLSSASSQPTIRAFSAPLDAVEKHLKRGDYLFRYIDADDFGEPHTSFNLCTFWYIDALARVGRRDEARDLVQQDAGAPQRPRSAVGRPRPAFRRTLGATSRRPTRWSGSSRRRFGCPRPWESAS